MALLDSAASILANCEEDGDCLIWQGATNSQGLPTAWSIKRHGPVVVTRALYCLRKGIALDDLAGRLVWQICRNPACLEEEHSRCGTRKQFLAWRRSVGQTAKSPAEIAATMAAVRRKATKLTPEIARAIRDDPRDQDVIAKERGISQQMVSSIKRGVSWRECVPNSSVFYMAA